MAGSYNKKQNMLYYNGNTGDSTDFPPEKYLQLNSCGFQNKKINYTIFRKKGRNDYTLILVTSGTCETLFNGKTHILGKGDICLYAPHEEQRYFITEGSTALYLHFTGFNVEEILETYSLKSGIYYLGDKNNQIYETFQTCMSRFNHPWRKLLSTASLLELFGHISLAAQPFTKNRELSDLLESILAYINLNFNKDITLDELSRKSGYSKSRFSHIFAEVTGTTPIRYQNSIRLKNASELLSATNLSVSEISYSCGFKDPLYFSRIFKKSCGLSPNQFRKMKRCANTSAKPSELLTQNR